jgi:pyruvate kinase
MKRIIEGVESELNESRNIMDWKPRESTVEDAVTAAACRAAELLNATAVVAYTQSGSTAMRLSQHRPKTRILAITPSDSIRRRLTLSWGVRSALVEEVLDTDSMVETAEKIVKEIGYGCSGEIIVVTSGTPIGVAGSTNLMTIHKIK